MPAAEGIGVVTFREQHYLHVHPFGKHEVDSAQGGMHAGGIPVVHDRHVLRELMDKPDLLHGEGGAAGGHHVAYPELMHHDHVDIALDLS